MHNESVINLPMLYKIGISLFLVIGITGCKESSFELSPESRLPKWIDVESNSSRNDYKLTMDYYLGPWNAEAVFILYDINGDRKIKLQGEISRKPLKLKSPPSGYPRNYPMYQVITINGVTDIIEHRKMESVFHITDDPAIWKELVSNLKGSEPFK